MLRREGEFIGISEGRVCRYVVPEPSPAHPALLGPLDEDCWEEGLLGGLSW